jgi:NAD(P)H-hydrate epimerase
MRGAAALATLGALRTGAGLVTLASEKEVIDALSSSIFEAVWFDTDTGDMICKSDEMNAVGIGCGSGETKATLKNVKYLLSREGAPLVIDADGLNSLAMHHSESLSRLGSSKRTVILTPHPLELARLMAPLSVSEVQADRIGSALRFAKASHATVVLKGAATIVASGDGALSINTSGGPALAKAGSGDVLAGAIAAFLAEGLSAHDAASLAVYLHGAAGDRLASDLSEYGVLASELPAMIAREIRDLERLRDGESK